MNGDKSQQFGNVVAKGMEFVVAFCADDEVRFRDECLEGFVEGGEWQSAYF